MPLNRLSQSELSVVTELPTYLGEQIKGQETAIHCLHQHLADRQGRFAPPGPPNGCFPAGGAKRRR
ncbi:type VI secretion ATPase, ClpV1 family [Serratia fonticola]|uniref:Type VI secretion ATPase, ClpV1 family n=1 Tax=Serratia fonticola TaxID=47917 RepID=A0A4U9US18_SERFO|nr:type VI secretion ATPase, ClpV1 family [Serratia fonticola]